MPTPIYMTVKGDKSGDIGGSVEEAGREGSMLINAVSHTIAIPTDVQTGQAQGRRVHGKFTVIKPIDKATPLLANALCTGDDLEVALKWFRMAKSKEEHYFTTTLYTAKCVSQKQYFPIIYDRANAEFPHLEEVEFTYQKIMWEHVVDGTNGEDDWNDPKA